MTTTTEPPLETDEPATSAAPRHRPGRLAYLLRDRTAVTGLAIVAVYFLAVGLGPLVIQADPNAIDPNRLASPSTAHPLGTDHLGRDTLARILHGGRISIGIALTVTAGTTAIGLALGMAAGYIGGLVDTLISRLIDILQALPGLLLALALVGVLGPSLRNLVIALTAVGWASDARLVRSLTLSVREATFVDAARGLGARKSRILRTHILPNVVGPTMVLATLTMGSALLAVSGLSFLGLGASPPSPEWGAMLNEAKDHLDRAPAQLLYPGLAISVFALAFNLLGDGLRDVLDPRLRDRGSW